MRSVAAAAVLLISAASCSDGEPRRTGSEPPSAVGTTTSSSQVKILPTSTSVAVPDDPNRPDGPFTLRRVDQRTLEDVTGSSPDVFGEWFNTAVSASGHWLGIMTYADEKSYAGVFDLVRGEMAGPIADLGGEFFGLWVDDDGTLYMIRPSGTEPGLHRLGLGDAETEVVAALAVGLSRRGSVLLNPDGSRFAVFGTGSRPTFDFSGSPVLYVVDLTSGVQRELGLNFIAAGYETLQDTGVGPLVKTWDPIPVWDSTRDLVYIIHADADRITVIDLVDLTIVTDEEFNPLESALVSAFSWLIPPAHAKFYDGNRRTGVLSSDGSELIVATGVSEAFQQSDGRWANVETPLGIQVIDIDDFTETDRVDLPVDSVALSPDGRLVFASGTSRAWSEGGENQVEPHGLFVLDAGDMAEIAHFDFGQSVGSPVFSPGGTIAYVPSWSENTGATTLHAIDLETMEVVGERDHPWGTFVPEGAFIADRRG